jgi:hypothetical protein
VEQERAHQYRSAFGNYAGDTRPFSPNGYFFWLEITHTVRTWDDTKRAIAVIAFIKVQTDR